MLVSDAVDPVARSAEGNLHGLNSTGASVQHVTIVPYEELLDSPTGQSDHRGGPIWSDWAGRHFERHCRNGKPADELPTQPAAVARVNESVAWGGPITKHFGHQIADFSMRLLPTVLTRPDLPIAFATKPGYKIRSLGEIPAFVTEIHDWFGVNLAERRLVVEPVEYEYVHVEPQLEQLGGPGPSTEALDLLDDLTDRRIDPRETTRTDLLFVSRSGQQWRFAGERYIDHMVASAGGRVIRPENLRVAEQLREYRHARRILFSEGSAIHGLQLLGRLDASIDVLVRRPGFRIAERLIAPRVSDLTYRAVSRGVVHGLWPTGKPARTVGMSVIDSGMLLDVWETFGLAGAPAWDERAFAAARDEDIRDWLSRLDRTSVSRSDESLDLIRASMDECGVGHLASDVRNLVRTD